jgi:Putative peptidoglycan binding domain
MQSRYYSGPGRDVRRQRAGVTAGRATPPDRAWSRLNAANRQRLNPQTKERLRNWQGKAPGYADAKRHHQEQWQDRKHHDHDWWRHHCDAIVLVGGGFWGWYDGWWYPAWGYDPYYSYYDYNGPIYGYDGLQPDEVIANVQAALQQLGYYDYAVDGVLGSATEAAIANYQRDRGLPVTGAIDPATVQSLGLSS